MLLITGLFVKQIMFSVIFNHSYAEYYFLRLLFIIWTILEIFFLEIVRDLRRKTEITKERKYK